MHSFGRLLSESKQGLERVPGQGFFTNRVALLPSALYPGLTVFLLWGSCLLKAISELSVGHDTPVGWLTNCPAEDGIQGD